MLKTGLKLNPKKLYGADGYAVKAHVWRMPAPLMMMMMMMMMMMNSQNKKNEKKREMI